MLFIYIGCFTHTYAPGVAALAGNITIYEAENAALSRRKIPRGALCHLYYPSYYALSRCTAAFSFWWSYRFTSSLFFFLFFCCWQSISSRQHLLDCVRLGKKTSSREREREKRCRGPRRQYVKQHVVPLSRNKLQSTYFHWNCVGDEWTEESKCERKYRLGPTRCIVCGGFVCRLGQFVWGDWLAATSCAKATSELLWFHAAISIHLCMQPLWRMSGVQSRILSFICSLYLLLCIHRSLLQLLLSSAFFLFFAVPVQYCAKDHFKNSHFVALLCLDFRAKGVRRRIWIFNATARLPTAEEQSQWE